ncbi:MAG: hypothetical protein H7Z75_00150 [Ferruginibacter sp.]|nr:hypothetical protein [Cytophagales bacterium]
MKTTALNGVLLVHFGAFLRYFATLLVRYREKTKRTNRLMLGCGVALLITGGLLVWLRYPAVNYYKVIPKTAILVAISALTAANRTRALSTRTYRSLIALTVLAACIAAFWVA